MRARGNSVDADNGLTAWHDCRNAPAKVSQDTAVGHSVTGGVLGTEHRQAAAVSDPLPVRAGRWKQSGNLTDPLTAPLFETLLPRPWQIDEFVRIFRLFSLRLCVRFCGIGR